MVDLSQCNNKNEHRDTKITIITITCRDKQAEDDEMHLHNTSKQPKNLLKSVHIYTNGGGNPPKNYEVNGKGSL